MNVSASQTDFRSATATLGGGPKTGGATPPPKTEDTPPPFLTYRNAPRCGFCGRSDSPDDGIYLRECSGCLNMFYCSKEHQIEDWLRHKQDCKASQLKPRVLLDPLPSPPKVEISPSSSCSPTFTVSDRRPSVIRMAGKSADHPSSSEFSNENAAQNSFNSNRNSPNDDESSVKNDGFVVQRGRHSASKRPAAECLSLTTIPERRATFGTADLGLYRQNKQTGGSGSSFSAAATNFLDPNQFTNLVNPINSSNNNRRMGMAPEFASKMVLSEPGPRKFDHSINPRINLNTDHRFKSSPLSNSTSLSPLAQAHRRDQTFIKIYKIAQCASVMLKRFGWAVFDNFLGPTHAQRVFEEVQELYETPGKFDDGQLVKTKEGSSTLDIRSDKIYWFNNWEDQRNNIGFLVSMIDSVVGNMRDFPYTIEGRCKPMIACYPGSGSKYVQHVDNPDKDGRLITAIYYLNANWRKETGGVLRLFPITAYEPVDIEPIFDRLIFFWSDKRNPHEVLPSFGIRYAITIWYFDKEERAKFSKAGGRKDSNQQSPYPEFSHRNIFPSSAVGGSVDQLNNLQGPQSSFHQNQLTPEAAGLLGASNWGPAGGSRVPSLHDLPRHDVLPNGLGALSLFSTEAPGPRVDTTQLLREAADQLAAVDDDSRDCPGRRNTLDMGHFQHRANSRGVYHGLGTHSVQSGGSRAPYYYGRKSMATVPESRSPENELA